MYTGRKKKEKQGKDTSPPAGPTAFVNDHIQPGQLTRLDRRHAFHIRGASYYNAQSFDCQAQLSDRDGYRILPNPDDSEKTRQWQLKAYQDYMLNVPKLSFLHLLIRINALNALAQNAKHIGIPVHALCRDEFVSPICVRGPLLPTPTVPLPNCPEILHPTEMQKTVFHHPWLDLLPLPRLRDNILKALAFTEFDEDKLCEEVYHPEDDGEGVDRPALIVWGRADDIRGWEANMPFLRKWGWLLVGCPELLESTNIWRMTRGKKAINLDLWRKLE